MSATRVPHVRAVNYPVSNLDPSRSVRYARDQCTQFVLWLIDISPYLQGQQHRIACCAKQGVAIQISPAIENVSSGQRYVWSLPKCDYC